MGIERGAPVVSDKCATPDCHERAEKLWGIDRQPLCPSCYAETALLLEALLQRTEQRDTENAKRRITE